MNAMEQHQHQEEEPEDEEQWKPSGSRFVAKEETSMAHPLGEEEEEDDDEDDDDRVRRSWATETPGETAIPSHQWNATSVKERPKEEAHEEDQHEEEEEEGSESEEQETDERLHSMDWMTSELRLSDDVALSKSQLEEQDQENINLAIEMLNKSLNDHDILNELMEIQQQVSQQLGQGEEQVNAPPERVDQTVGIANTQELPQDEQVGQQEPQIELKQQLPQQQQKQQQQQEEQQQQEQQKQKQKQKPTTSEELNEQDDEWQEAYTAKGRVYYYNRRTRESSWKRPERLAVKDHQSTAPEQNDAERDNNTPTFDLSSSLGRSQPQIGSQAANDQHEKAQVEEATEDQEEGLFCVFCGFRLALDAWKDHVQDCSVRRHHQENRTQLFKSFEQMLCVLSEDESLRSLHYAASFPDKEPSPVRSSSATSPSIKDNLVLLRRHEESQKSRPHSRSVSKSDMMKSSSPYGTPTNQQNHGHDHRHQQQQGADPGPATWPRQSPIKSGSRHPQTLSSQYNAAHARSKATTPNKKPPASLPGRLDFGSKTTTSLDKNTSSSTNIQCRYCKRNFANGNLEKHESVCPRVFGNEITWGKPFVVAPSPNLQQRLQRSHQQILDHRHRKSTSPHKSTGTNLDKNKTLETSYREYQAQLVECPCCQRKFAPSGAKEHISICQSVQNRPKNPIPVLRRFASAS